MTESLELLSGSARGLDERRPELRASMARVRAIAQARSATPEVQRWESHIPIGGDTTAASRSAVEDVLGNRVPHGPLVRAQAIVAALLLGICARPAPAIRQLDPVVEAAAM